MVKIEIYGVELTITQVDNFVTVSRVVARDRKRKLDITSGRTFKMPEKASELIDKLKKVANYKTARCTCDYSRYWSDHAEHCQSIYKASTRDEDYCCDDD